MGPKRTTLSSRLRAAIVRPDGTEWRPVEILAAADRLLEGTGVTLSQQNLSAMMNGAAEMSKYAPIVAEVLGVRAMWLAVGQGPMRSTEGLRMPPGAEQRHYDLLADYLRLAKGVRHHIRYLIHTLARANDPAYLEMERTMAEKSEELRRAAEQGEPL